MSDRETRLRVTALRLSEMLELLDRSHENLLPHDPRRFWIESQAPLELARQLAKELRELLGVESEHRQFLNELANSPAVVPPLPGVDSAPNSLAGKE
jgi:hypothetical protein